MNWICSPAGCRHYTNMIYTFNITPMGKPRMTQRDKWANREVVGRYWLFKDELVRMVNEQGFILPDLYTVTFYIPMPSSWSKKKKDKMRGQPHKQTPDTDNLVKALNDCLRDQDSAIWNIHAIKYWDDVGRIEITI